MSASGIDMTNLQEAFLGSEDVLVQMLTLFQVQSQERMEQLTRHLQAWEPEAARAVLHSLVNISGAVRAYGMSDLSKAVGDAIKRDEPDMARALGKALALEAALAQRQTQALLEAGGVDPVRIWTAQLPAA